MGSELSGRSFLLRFVACTVLLNICVICLATVWLRTSRQQYYDRATITTQNLTLVLEQNITGVFKQIDVSLIALSKELERRLRTKDAVEGPQLENYMAELRSGIPEIEGLRFADARGRALAGFAKGPTINPDVSDRDYFIKLRDNPGSGSFISKPVKGRISGKWVIVVSRRVNHPDGRFAGIVFAALPLEYLEKLFTSIDVGSYGAFALRQVADLSLVARYPEPQGIGRSVGHKLMSRQFLQAMAAKPGLGTYDAPSGLDKRMRTWSYRRFANQSYYIFVGLAQDEYLATWHREAIIAEVLVGLFAVGSVLVSLILYRSWSMNRSALEALLASERREKERAAELNAIMESVPAVILVARDETGQAVTGNRLASELLQIPLDGNYSKNSPVEAGPRHYKILHDNQEIPPRQLPLQLALKGEQVKDYQQDVLFQDGTRLTLLGNAAPLMDGNGKIRGALAAFLDVSTQARTSAALKESEERYRVLFERSPDGIALVDPQGFQIRFFNDTACADLNYTREEFGKLTIMDLDPIEDLTVIRQRSKSLVETGHVKFETIHLTKQGEPRNVEVQLQFVTIAGQLLVCSLFRDITERIKAETALRSSEEKFRTFVESSIDLIFVLDAEGVFRFISPSWELHFGYPAADALGEHFSRFAHPDDVRPCVEYLNRVLSSGVGESSPAFRVRHADGSWRTFVTNGTTYLDGNGTRLFLGVGRDISEQQRSEEERITMERKLLHSQKLESLGVLAGGIAHDFNNLLVAILGNLDLALLRLPESSPVRGNIEQSMLASRRAADLTRQMLAYSGKGAFELKSVNLNTLVTENLDLFKAVVPRNVKFSIQAASALPAIFMDPGQVQQVVMNLITNAVEAIGQGQGVVTLTTGTRECDEEFIQKSRLEEKPAPGWYVFVQVTDNGCGMDEATQARIFEPFFTTKFAGRGLGMSATLGIVRTHQGMVLLESAVGTGTTFCILFPVQDKAEFPAGAPGESSRLAPPPAAVQRGKVLVADDEELVRAVGVQYVRHFGFEVLEACDGSEAVDLVRSDPEITLVILDLAMPNMDGITAFHEMKKIRPDLHIILSSGYSEQSFVELFPKERPDAFIQKPFRLKELERVIATSRGAGT